MNGRMTQHAGTGALGCWIGPQWSRPMNGRMTQPLLERLWQPHMPQWSRPMNGRMTSRVSDSVPWPASRNGAGR